MAIRAMWGFNHLPQKTAIGIAGSSYGLAYNGYGITFANSYGTCMIDGNAIVIVNNTNADVGFGFPVSAVTDMVSPKSIIGFRFKTTNLYYGASITIASVSTNMTELGVPNVGEVYVEVVCDRVAKELNFFVNGVFKLKKTTTVAPMIAGQVVSFRTANNGGISVAVSDWYFIDDTQDDTPCTRLGPVIVVPLNMNSVVGQDWTSSDNKPLIDDLKVLYVDAATLAAPLITSPTSMAPLEIAHDELVDKNATVIGVTMVVDSKRIPASLTALNASLKNGQASKSIGDVLYVNDNINYTPLGVATKSPDGTAWSVAKLTATKFVLTPKSAS